MLSIIVDPVEVDNFSHFSDSALSHEPATSANFISAVTRSKNRLKHLVGGDQFKVKPSNRSDFSIASIDDIDIETQESNPEKLLLSATAYLNR